MAPATTSATTIVTAIAVLLALLGVGLCWWGLFPRRRGDTPFCRKCGYNLTGLALDALGAACPECGAPVGVPGHVVIGARKRRPAVIALGGFMLLIGGGAIGLTTSGVLRTMNWYPLKPTFWLLRELKTATGDQAAAELEKRRLAGKLTTDDLAKWIDAAIAAEAAPKRSTAQKAVIKSLGPLLKAQQVTPEQLARFGQAVCRNITFTVRPQVLAEERIPCQTRYQADLPDGLALRIVLGEVESSGAVLSRGGSASTTASGGPGSCGSSLDSLAVGRHPIHVSVTVGLLRGQNWDAPVSWSQEITFDAEVEVLPPGAKDTVRLVATGGDWARRHIRLRQIQIEKRAWSQQKEPKPYLSLNVEYDRAAPVAYAFDVIAQGGTTRVNLGTTTIAAARTDSDLYSTNVQRELPDEFDPNGMVIILEPSPAAARQTVDIFADVWGGTLVFGDLGLEQRMPGYWYPRDKGPLYPLLVRDDPNAPLVEVDAEPNRPTRENDLGDPNLGRPPRGFEIPGLYPPARSGP
jgi:hypothetical protein